MQKPLIALTGRKGSALVESTAAYFFEVANYIERVWWIGVLIPMTDDYTQLKVYLERFDGLVLQGWSDINPLYYHQDLQAKLAIDHERDKFEFKIAKMFLKANKPVFGICRGMQIINCLMGGDLYQNIPESKNIHMPDLETKEDYPTQNIIIKENTWLATILKKEKILVNTYHNQAIKTLWKGLLISAEASDGIIEAMEWIENQILACQWHPEWLLNDENSKKIFKSFIEMC